VGWKSHQISIGFTTKIGKLTNITSGDVPRIACMLNSAPFANACSFDNKHYTVAQQPAQCKLMTADCVAKHLQIVLLSTSNVQL